MIREMLNKNLVERLSKISFIKNHPYLKNFSWTSLLSMEMQAPHTFKIRFSDNDYEKIPFLTFLRV